MVIILMRENLIKLVTVMLPADGFGSSSLVATFEENLEQETSSKPQNHLRANQNKIHHQNWTKQGHHRDDHGERCDGGGGNEKRSSVDGHLGPRRPNVEAN